MQQSLDAWSPRVSVCPCVCAQLSYKVLHHTASDLLLAIKHYYVENVLISFMFGLLFLLLQFQ